jgi:ribosomal protein L37E
MNLYSLASSGGGGFYLFNEGQQRDLCRVCGWNRMHVTGIARAEPVEGGGYDPVSDPVYVFGGQMLASEEAAAEIVRLFSNIALGPVKCNRLIRGRGTSNDTTRHVYVKECFSLDLESLPKDYLIECVVCGRSSYNTREARSVGVALPVNCPSDVGLARVCFEYPMLLATEGFREYLEERNYGRHLIWRDYGFTTR